MSNRPVFDWNKVVKEKEQEKNSPDEKLSNNDVNNAKFRILINDEFIFQPTLASLNQQNDTNINVLLVGASRTGKSTIIKVFEDPTYTPPSSNTIFSRNK